MAINLHWFFDDISIPVDPINPILRGELQEISFGSERSVLFVIYTLENVVMHFYSTNILTIVGILRISIELAAYLVSDRISKPKSLICVQEVHMYVGKKHS